MIEMICGGAKIVIIVSTGAVEQRPQVHIKIIDGDITVADGLGRRQVPCPVQVKLVFKMKLCPIEASVGISALEAYADGIISILVEGLVISR